MIHLTLNLLPLPTALRSGFCPLEWRKQRHYSQWRGKLWSHQVNPASILLSVIQGKEFRDMKPLLKPSQPACDQKGQLKLSRFPKQAGNHMENCSETYFSFSVILTQLTHGSTSSDVTALVQCPLLLAHCTNTRPINCCTFSVSTRTISNASFAAWEIMLVTEIPKWGFSLRYYYVVFRPLFLEQKL